MAILFTLLPFLFPQVTEDRESQYFNTLEKKESYETKLLETHWMDGVMFFCPQIVEMFMVVQ